MEQEESKSYCCILLRLHAGTLSSPRPLRVMARLQHPPLRPRTMRRPGGDVAKRPALETQAFALGQEEADEPNEITKTKPECRKRDPTGDERFISLPSHLRHGRRRRSLPRPAAASTVREGGASQQTRLYNKENYRKIKNSMMRTIMVTGYDGDVFHHHYYKN